MKPLIKRQKPIRRLVSLAVMSAALGLAITGVRAHHSSQAEFGPFGSETIGVEGTIVAINWSNPHISIDIQTTGGEVPAGENWRLVSHPVQIMIAYGFTREEFNEGDRVELLGWKNLRGAPMIWPRAIRINDGPLKSNLRFTDMIDIARGEFESMGIVPAANLNGSPPERSGPDTVQKLAEMGLLDDEGLVIWPPGNR